MTEPREDGVVLEAEGIRLRLAPDLSCRVEARTAKGWMGPCGSGTAAGERTPFHSLVLDGVAVDRFRLQPRSLKRGFSSTPAWSFDS